MHDLGLREYLHVLRRRKWIVLQALVIVPLVAVALALRQSPLYQASADVLLRYQSLPSALSDITDPNSSSYFTDPIRSTATQLEVASLPALADRVATALRPEHVTTGEVLGSTSVLAKTGTDFLSFQATSGSPALAALIVNEYARQYTVYRQQLDTGSITKPISDLQRRIDQFKAQGGAHARSQVAQLQAKVDQLETLLSLETSNAVVVRKATGAAKIRPRPTRYGLLGLGLGLVLGIGLAFLRDAFDTRLRTTDQIGGLLGLPLLARIPEPPRQLQRDSKLAMIAEPAGSGAEAFRRLRMNLEFATLGKQSQVIMVTSAVEKEGKSTTVANLAVAMALAGKGVALVDLDLRRPALGSFFRLDAKQPGLSAVVLGYADLDDALVQIPLDPLSRNSGDRFGRRPDEQASAANTNGAGAAPTGSLLVLPTGIVPPNPGEFVGLERVERVIAGLRERVDIVLLDAPPLLPVGDALTIGSIADALVVVVRADLARRQVTGELARILGRMPGEQLGFVLCGAGGIESYPYYGYSGHRYEPGQQHAEESVR